MDKDYENYLERVESEKIKDTPEFIIKFNYELAAASKDLISFFNKCRTHFGRNKFKKIFITSMTGFFVIFSDNFDEAFSNIHEAENIIKSEEKHYNDDLSKRKSGSE